jgi:predicted DNA binding CopG/RHH family protein
MKLDEIIEISENSSEQLDEKLVWQTQSDGSVTRKVICPKGQKKDGTICVPMNSSELRASRKRMITRGFTYDLKPLILKKAAKRRKKALKFKF